MTNKPWEEDRCVFCKVKSFVILQCLVLLETSYYEWFMMKDLIQWKNSNKPPTHIFTQQNPAGVNPKDVLAIWTVLLVFLWTGHSLASYELCNYPMFIIIGLLPTSLLFYTFVTPGREALITGETFLSQLFQLRSSMWEN